MPQNSHTMKTLILPFVLLLSQLSVASPRSVTCMSYSGRCKLEVAYVSAQDKVTLKMLPHDKAHECGLSVGQKLVLKPEADQNAHGWQSFRGYDAADDRWVRFRFNTPVIEETVFQAGLQISLQGNSMSFFENSITCQ